MQEGSSQRWSMAIACSGFVAVAAGFTGHRLWQVLPWERFALSLLLAAISTALAWPVARLARLSMASALLLVWLLAAVFFVGAVPLLVITLLALAAWSLGLHFGCGSSPPAAAAAPAIATALGLTLLGGVAGWLLTWPLHRFWLWALVLIALMAWQRRALRAALIQTARSWRDAVREAPQWSAFAVTLLGLASTACWFPTMQADDLAYHLGLPSQLLAHGQYRPVAQHQIWAHAPWLGDTLHGVGFVLARGDARGALNLLWLAIAAGATWTLAAVSQSNLQGRVWSVAILSGGLLALKLIHGLAALPLLAHALWPIAGQGGRQALGWRRLLLATALFLTVAGSSYVSAWWHTGNPVFPLFNTVFQSPDYPLRDFVDPRWDTGFDLLLPWRLVFDTDTYFEAWDGAIGFALVALAGGTVLAIRKRATRGIALAACAALLLTLLSVQYARYAFPVLILLAVLSLPALQEALQRRAAVWLVVGLCVLNLAFQANASWLHHSAALKRLIRAGGEESMLFPHYTPERTLLRSLPSASCNRVLATDPERNTVAELAGCGRTVSAHDPSLATLRAAADRDDSGQRWLALMRASGAHWLLVTPAVASTGLQAGLRLAGARRVERVGDAELWQLSDLENSPAGSVP